MLAAPDRVAVIVGPDGSGRTHALRTVAAAHEGPVVAVAATPFDWDVPFGGLRPLLGADAASPDPDAVAARIGRSAVVVVDDAHHLEPSSLRFLAALAAAGVRVVVAHAPVSDPVLAALDEALAAGGRIEQLRPLDEEGAAAVIIAATGRAAPTTTVTRLLADCGGLPALIAAAATEPDAELPTALADRVTRRTRLLSAGAGRVLAVMAASADLPDRVVARLAGVDEEQLGVLGAELVAAGLVTPDERVVPVVARAVLAGLPGAERRRLEAGLAGALLELGVDPVVAAGVLRRAHAGGPDAAAVFALAGERLRHRQPEAALGWFDDAVAAGADPAHLAGARAEAAAAAGQPLPSDAPADARGRARLRAAQAVVAVRDGRWDRAAELTTGIDDHDLGAAAELLGVPARVAIGDLDGARTAVGPTSPDQPTARALHLLAQAVIAAGTDAPDAVARFVEADEAAQRQPLEAPVAVTGRALGALVASRLGDVDAAEQLLGPVSGDPAVGLHALHGGVHEQLVRGWVRLRAGRFDTPVTLARALRGRELDGRDRLLLAAVEAGLARRSGDVARLRSAWEAAEAALIRQTVDLWSLEPLGELLVAAARLRHHHRVAPLLERLREFVDRLGGPPGWRSTLAWLELELALVDERVEELAAPAAELAAIAATAATERHRALATAAARWVDVLDGSVAFDAVVAAADALAGTGLPWEGSRLAGQAAIRTPDPSVARRLLERARDLAGGDVPTDEVDADASGLSERELEVARYVADGLTHKEIGAQLYISPKTVEHHVARIRTKLGATTRAEMLAAIRSLLGSDAG